MSVLNIKYGLFNYSFWRHPIQWLKELRIYHDRKRFLLKHGFSPVCQWEYYSALLELFEQVLTFMRNERDSDIPFEKYPETTWHMINNHFYDKLLKDIKVMKDYDNLSDNPEEIERHKKHFFQQLEKYFYHLWD